MNEVIDLSKLNESIQELDAVQRCLPRGLSKDDAHRLFSIVRNRYQLKRGEHVFYKGDKADCIFAVSSGVIKSYIPTDHGEEQILGFHLSREIFGLDAFGEDIFSYSAMALENADVCEIPLEQMDQLCLELTGFRHVMHGVVGKEISQEHEMLLMLGKKSAESRLAGFLINISNRLADRGYEENTLELKMSRRDIGNYLGLAEETVSRMFSRFQDENLLKVDRRHVSIQNRDLLHELMDR